MPGGRPAKPSHLKLVSGTTRSHKRGAGKRRPEPQPPRGVGDPPAHLSPRAASAWRYVSVILDRMGVLTEADTLALEHLCSAYADGLEARTSLANPAEIMDVGTDGIQVVAQGGSLTYVTVGKSGPMLRTRPEVAIIADADRRFLAYLVQFGLTPASRTKIQVPEGAEQDQLEAYFG